jgi:hypothetical protein
MEYRSVHSHRFVDPGIPMQAYVREIFRGDSSTALLTIVTLV